ncbi:MAG: hypothetical protein ACOY5F_14435 [Pseudomonadota bacterium]
MCLVPDIPAPQTPPETQEMKQPDGAAARSAVSRRTGDRVRSSAATVLTSGSGVTASAPTDKKTLLGQ